MARVMQEKEIINFLRNNLLVGEPDYAHYHSDYGLLTDETLLSFVLVAASRDFPGIDVTKGVLNPYVYPIVLGAKREVLWMMCSKYAPLYDIKALQTTMMREQAFKHYQLLLTTADNEYANFMNGPGKNLGDGTETGGGGSDGVWDGDEGYGPTGIRVRHLVSDRDYWNVHGHLYGKRPKVALIVQNVGADFIELTWNFPAYEKFWKLMLVARNDENQLFDHYRRDACTPGTWHVYTWHRFPERGYRMENLSPGVYSLGIKYFERNGLTAISEELGILVGEENVGDEVGEGMGA